MPLWPGCSGQLVGLEVPWNCHKPVVSLQQNSGTEELSGQLSLGAAGSGAMGLLFFKESTWERFLRPIVLAWSVATKVL